LSFESSEADEVENANQEMECDNVIYYIIFHKSIILSKKISSKKQKFSVLMMEIMKQKTVLTQISQLRQKVFKKLKISKKIRNWKSMWSKP